ncbi:hypothetical protein AB0C34_23615 [Nocardia sp. NPDC049220]
MDQRKFVVEVVVQLRLTGAAGQPDVIEGGGVHALGEVLQFGCRINDL